MSEEVEETDEEKRERLAAMIEDAENELMHALYHKEATTELEKLREKKAKPPQFSKLRRSKMNREEKRKVITEFGIDTYNEIPL